MGQYDKYICTTLEKRHLLPGPTPAQRDRLAAQGKRISMEHLHWIDEEVIPGAYYGETTWIWPPTFWPARCCRPRRCACTPHSRTQPLRWHSESTC